jgi:hypothetical protein
MAVAEGGEVLRVVGRSFGAQEVEHIVEVVKHSAGLSRYALACQICELVQWRRSNGALKVRECRDLLEELERRGALALPPKRSAGRPAGTATQIPLTLWGAPRPTLHAALQQCVPIELRLVESKSDHARWRELVGRYHYLGCATAFGAKLRYVAVIRGAGVVGCLQYSSAAWRLAGRDQWIGWSEAQRLAGLQRVVQQSRFLILPWVKVRYLASHLLSLSVRVLGDHWEQRYGRRPVLVETLVDRQRFAGTCYRAANWIEVGTTSGRGRMDRHHQRHAAAPKAIFLYALQRAPRAALCA